MLMTMKAQVEAMRALSALAARSLDISMRHPDRAERQKHQAVIDLLTPVVKGWCTEQGIEIASLGVQVHGGMGFVEETGAAQHLRDARIATIYEGTTGIQANDLIGRKLAAEKGMTAKRGDRGDARLRPRARRSRAAIPRSACCGETCADGVARWRRRPTGCWRRIRTTPRPRPPARCPISSCGAPWPAAGRWRARR